MGDADLRDVLNDGLRRRVQLPGIADDELELAQGGGVVVPVADALVQHEGEIQVSLPFDGAVGLGLVDPPFRAESEEHRAGAEVVER